MNLLFSCGNLFFIFLMGISGAAWNRSQEPAVLATSVSQDSALQAFAFAAKQYVASTAAPAAATAYYWADIKNAPNVPPSVTNITIPPDWRIVRTPTTWAICATVDEPVIARITAKMPQDRSTYRVSQAVAVGVTDTTSAASAASLCSTK